MISKVSEFFQMQMVTPNAPNFVLQTNFCLGGRGPQNSAKKITQKRGILVENPLFLYISALFGPFYDLFGPFLTLFNKKTSFLALLGKKFR